MAEKLVTGVYVAVLTPRSADGSIDAAGLGAVIRFLMGKGISSFAVNGATGELCLTTPDELRMMLTVVQEASAGRAEILCGVGAPGTARAKELAVTARSASYHGAVKGLLLPMPYFFPYQQEDLELFCREVAASTELPILLYNLPQFTSGLAKETVRRLITEVANIVGIKDSSGSLEILRDLTEHGVDACRLVGNDTVYAQALQEGVCDGIVSGVACPLPELIQALWREAARTESEEFASASRLLDEFIAQLNAFPTPWGLKWTAEARGIVPATFSQPVTQHRREQGRAVVAWMQEWLPGAIEATTR
ncbi:dihydrodipicolinate synthase family protein [Granulicella sp. dw_53]|uniref:dihydrodipicolinate synthase family protein n=1 Tax=Granulicella sp. dw_53 TaxID=2719792 RepID=UPI001BD51840|nr:dihydrodipicolinate synthase family protein [Granulicella sp. dw_53]